MDLIFKRGAEDLPNNFLYTRWISNLVGKSVYDTDKTAYPLLGTPFTFEIQSNTTNLKNVYFNDILINSSSDQVFEIQVYPVIGRVNNLYAQDINGSKTRIFYFTVYNLHFLPFTVTSILFQMFKQLQQKDADKTLTEDNTKGVFQTPYIASDKALFKFFGSPLEVERIDATQTEYLKRLRDIKDAFYYSGTIRGLKSILAAFSLSGLDIVSYLTLEEFRSSSSVYVRRSNSLTVEWFPSKVYFNGKRYLIEYGTKSLSSNSKTFLYTDGSINANNNLIIKSTSTEPLIVDVNLTPTYTSSEIYVDVDGSITGLKNGLYIITDHEIKKFNTISSDGAFKIKSATIISKHILFLKTDWDVSHLGNVVVDYNTQLRPLILAKVTTNSDVSKIESPIPERGSVFRTQQKENSDFDLYINDESLTQREINQLVDLLKSNTVATGIGHLYVKDSSVILSDYEYHKNNFRFENLI